MGSDLSMNPPKPAEYRAKWEDNHQYCVVERRHEMEHHYKWYEVWRGIPTEDVKKAFRAMGFILPPKPRTEYEYSQLEAGIRNYLETLQRELTLRQNYAGDPDPGGTKMLAEIVKNLERIMK